MSEGVRVRSRCCDCCCCRGSRGGMIGRGERVRGKWRSRRCLQQHSRRSADLVRVCAEVLTRLSTSLARFLPNTTADSLPFRCGRATEVDAATAGAAAFRDAFLGAASIATSSISAATRSESSPCSRAGTRARQKVDRVRRPSCPVHSLTRTPLQSLHEQERERVCSRNGKVQATTR